MNICHKIIKFIKEKFIFIISLLIMVLVVHLSTGEYSLFRNIFEFLCASIGMAIVFISFTRNYKGVSVFNYIGYGFTIICFLSISRIVLLNYLSIYSSIPNISSLYIQLATSHVEILIVIIAIICIRFKPKTIWVISMYGAVAAIIVFVTFYISKYKHTTENFFPVYYYLWLFLIVWFVSAVILNFSSMNFLEERDSQYIYFYLALIFIYIIILSSGFNSSSDTPIFAQVFKVIAYITVLKGLNDTTINEAYKSMSNDLEIAEEKNSQLNKTLNDRLILLDEMNKMLSKSENNYSRLLESISDGIIIFFNGKIPYINSKALDLLQAHKDIILKLSLEDMLEKLNISSKVANKNFFKESIEIEIEGAIKYIDLYVFETENETKTLFMKDMTEKNKHFELQQELQKILEEEELKEQFFSNISHELRTPINVIFSSLQLKEMYIYQNNYESIKENTKMIKQNCLRLTRTINNFIDANKISEGFLKLNKSICNIVEVIENVAQASVDYLNKAHINLVFDSEEEEIYVKCDSEAIQRVILNLLSNAVKYSGSGTDVYIYILIENNKVKISFKNTGEAISDDIKPFLFDKFTKVNKALNRIKEGSGLGMYLSKGLINLHNGDIELISIEDVGNEFVITLPYEEAKEDCSCSCDNSYEMNKLREKVDAEFSDI